MIEKEKGEIKKYKFYNNKNDEIYINTFDNEYKKEINIYFEDNNDTDVMNFVINELIKEYVQNVINL